MKKIKIVVVVLLCLYGCKTTKQTMHAVNKPGNINKDITVIESQHIVVDTLDYAKSIIVNKNKYINKPFSVLLNDLKISIKSYSPGMGGNRYESPDVRVSFVDKTATANRQAGSNEAQKPVYLTIVWKKPLLNSEMIAAISTKSNNKGNWGPVEEEYFSKQIIGDLFYH